MRFLNYFEYEGKKYYTGTVMIVHNWKPKQKATFICYDTVREMYVYQIGRGKSHMNKNSFYNSIVEITDNVNNDIHMPEEKIHKDCNIDGLMYGWIWYIFLMVVSTIFNDRIAMWVIWSAVFFSWRAQKIKEEGNYIEW